MGPLRTWLSLTRQRRNGIVKAFNQGFAGRFLVAAGSRLLFVRAWVRQWWYQLGLTARLLGIVVLLLLGVQALVFWSVRTTIKGQARAQMEHELALSERVWRDQLARDTRRLREGAQLLASDYRFLSTLAQNDLAGTRSALNTNAERFGARITALFDNQLRLSATQEYDELFLLWLKSASYPQMGTGLSPHAAEVDTGRAATAHQEDTGSLAEGLRGIARSLIRQKRGDGLILVDGAPFQFVLVPVRPDKPLGWLLMGFPIDQGMIDDMRELLSVRMAVLASVRGEAPQTVASSLPDAALPMLALLASSGQVPEVEIDGEPHAVRQVLLEAQGGQVRTVLMRSSAEVMAPFRRLQWALGLITVLGLLMFGMAGWAALRRVTRPLRQLETAAEVLREGRFDVQIEAGAYRDEVGRLAQGFDTMRQSLARQRREILHLAYEDTLTGLPNRRSFIDWVQRVTGDVCDSAAVVVLSLDRFKHVNEVLGFAQGDALLRAVAHRLAGELFDAGHRVARIGGDEFAVLMQPGSAQQAQDLAQRLLEAFATSFTLDGQTVDLGVSIGLACWPADGGDAETLVARAQVAMHAAKRRTCGVLAYSPELDAASAQTLSLLSDLRRALAQDELRLYLQPKCAVADGRLVGAEALLRWQHPERGLVPPGEFIPFAEQTGFIRELTWWVMEQVVSQWAALQTPGQPRVVAVNLSTRDLMDAEFPARLRELLARHAVPTHGVCLEITESAIMDDPQRAQHTLQALSDAGFKLSIDDFGTGYSSLAYLKRLPVDELKIDKSFVMGMTADPNDAKIVRSTVELAHNLGLSVVAEGVEDEAVLAALRQLHCDVGQGYFWSKPVPVEPFLRWAMAQDAGVTGSPPAAALAPQA